MKFLIALIVSFSVLALLRPPPSLATGLDPVIEDMLENPPSQPVPIREVVPPVDLFVQIFWPIHTPPLIVPDRSARNMRPVCGGVLLGDRWVLTALHCASRFGRLKMDLQIMTSSGDRLDVKDIHYSYAPAPLRDHWNPQSNDDYEKDVALIELATPISHHPQFPTLLKHGELLEDIPSFMVGRWGSELKYSFCEVTGNLSNFLLGECHAQPGVSGSPLFTFERKALVLAGITLTVGEGVTFFADLSLNTWVHDYLRSSGTPLLPQNESSN